MPQSHSLPGVQVQSKASLINVPLGTIAENLSLSGIVVNILYDVQLSIGLSVVGTLENAQGVVIDPLVKIPLTQLENDFPGITMQLTAIADSYNPYKL